MKKILLAIALVTVAVFAGAQTAALHGYMDYTNMAVGQEFQQAADGTWSRSEAAAEFGSFYNGRTEVNAVVDAANFQFNLGIRMNASLQTWYNLYRSTDGTSALVDSETLNDGIATFFHQGNMRISFLNDQVRVYTGKFEEWNNGYIFGGYVLGGQSVSDLAMRDVGQHFTGVEVSPYALAGFRAMVGFPILPVGGNGVSTGAEHNQWKNLWKKVKIMASYKLPVGIVINAGIRPETHKEGTDSYSAENLFGEAFVQGDFPFLIPNLPFNATYDFRWRKEAANDVFTTAHYFGISGKLPSIGNVNISFENRFAYAADHYIAINEELIYDTIGFAATYAIPHTDYLVGMNLFGMYGQDAKGSGFSGEGRVSSKYCTDYAMDWDWMPYAAKPAAGSPGRYIGVYAYPYFQKNFANGYVRTGVEIQYTRFSTTNVTQAIGYRVPVAMCFWF